MRTHTHTHTPSLSDAHTLTACVPTVLVGVTEQGSTEEKKLFPVKALLKPQYTQRIQFTGNVKVSIENNPSHLNRSLMNQKPQMI